MIRLEGDFKEIEDEVFTPLKLTEEEIQSISSKDSFKELSKIKLELLLFYSCELINIKDLDLSTFANKAKERLEIRCKELFMTEIGDEGLPKLMDLIHSLFEKLPLVKKNEAEPLKIKTIDFWQVKDKVLKKLKDEGLDVFQRLWTIKKNNAKLYLKLKDLTLKNRKVTEQKFKDSDIDMLQKKLNDFDKAKLKISKDWEKHVKIEQKKKESMVKEIKRREEKEEKERARIEKEKLKLEKERQKQEQIRLKKEEKEEKERKLKEEKLRKELEKKEKEAKKVQMLTNSMEKSQNKLGIHNFFTKKDSLEKKETYTLVKFNRHSSIGKFNFEPSLDEARLDKLNKLFSRNETGTGLPQKKIFSKRKANVCAKEIRSSFLRFEDYLKDCIEYRGYLQQKQQKYNCLEQLKRFDEKLNYKLMTDDELQLLDAESLEGSLKESEDEDLDEQMDDFLVPDDYISDCETDSFKKLRPANTGKMTLELQLRIHDFRVNEVDREKIHDFTMFAPNLEFPLEVIPIKQQKKDDIGIDNKTMSVVVRSITGLCTKKEIYKVLDSKELDKSRKTVYKNIQDQSKVCYYVNPVNVEEHLKIDYFDLLAETEEEKKKIKLRKNSPFLKSLIKLLHGSPNTVEAKDKLIFSKLKKLFPNLTKANLDSTIKNIARVGTVFPQEYLEKLVS